MQRTFVFCSCMVVAITLPASAGVEFFDVPSPEWDAALDAAGAIPKGDVDFGLDRDYGAVGFEGPLTSKGGGPVSPGIVLDNMSIFGPIYVGHGTDLVALGPSQGFGNPTNAILANDVTDSLQIDFDDPDKVAMSIQVLTLLGGSGLDVRVFDANGNLLGIGNARNNETIGVLATDGDRIGGLNLFDRFDGYEGFMKATAYNIPEPTSLTLLALGVAAAVRRR